jgi:hypothetical protein
MLALQVVALGPNAASTINNDRLSTRASGRCPSPSGSTKCRRCVRPVGYDQVAASTTESDNGRGGNDGSTFGTAAANMSARIDSDLGVSSLRKRGT